MSVPLSQCKDKTTILLIVSYVVIIDQGEKLHFWLWPPLSPRPIYQIASWFSLPLDHIPQAAPIQFIPNWTYHLFPKPDLPPLLFSIPMQPRQEPRRFPQMLFHSLRWRSHRCLPPQLLSVGVLLFIPSAICSFSSDPHHLSSEPLHQPLSICPPFSSPCLPPTDSTPSHQGDASKMQIWSRHTSDESLAMTSPFSTRDKPSFSAWQKGLPCAGHQQLHRPALAASHVATMKPAWTTCAARPMLRYTFWPFACSSLSLEPPSSLQQATVQNPIPPGTLPWLSAIPSAPLASGATALSPHLKSTPAAPPQHPSHPLQMPLASLYYPWDCQQLREAVFSSTHSAWCPRNIH